MHLSKSIRTKSSRLLASSVEKIVGLELTEKGYIKRENNLCKLTPKGLCVALTLFNDLAEIQNFVDFQQFDLDIKNIFKETDKHPIIVLLKTKEGDNLLKERFSRIENDPQFSELFLYKLRSFTNYVIREGVNLDLMPEIEFTVFMANKLLFWIMGAS